MLLGGAESRTDLADTDLCKLVASLNSLVKGLVGHESGHEGTGKGVTGAVGVLDLVLGQRSDGVDLDLALVGLSDQGGAGTLGDDNGSGSGGVLGQVGHFLCVGLAVGDLGSQNESQSCQSASDTDKRKHSHAPPILERWHKRPIRPRCRTGSRHKA